MNKENAVQKKKFIKVLTELVNNISKRAVTQDEKADAMKVKTMLGQALNVDEDNIINIIGEYLVKYSDQIINGDDSIFLSNKNTIKQEHTSEFLKHMIETLQSKYLKLKEKEKQHIKDDIREIYEIYLEYVITK